MQTAPSDAIVPITAPSAPIRGIKSELIIRFITAAPLTAKPEMNVRYCAYHRGYPLGLFVIQEGDVGEALEVGQLLNLCCEGSCDNDE